MRRSLLAAMTAAVLLAWPAHAQIIPVPVSQPASGERILIDATIWVNPPFQQGLCMNLEAGLVTVTVARLGTPARPRPTEFHLYGFMADQDANLKLPVTHQEITGKTRVNGSDHYCWQFNVDAPEAERASNAERGDYVQTVALKITLIP